MNGAQDLGGMMGFGPVVPDPDQPLFHAAWERRALGLTLAAGACGMWNIDMSRHARETLPPPQYLTKSYYDIWISGLEKLLAATGMITAQERAQGKVLEPPVPVRRRLAAHDVPVLLRHPVPFARLATLPARFAAGDSVRMRVRHVPTHTRLPRYASGKTGVVEAVRGCFVFPDSSAHGKGEDAQWCYTIRFDGRELWGAGADPCLSVSIDAWEPYLEAL